MPKNELWNNKLCFEIFILFPDLPIFRSCFFFFFLNDFSVAHFIWCLERSLKKVREHVHISSLLKRITAFIRPGGAHQRLSDFFAKTEEKTSVNIFMMTVILLMRILAACADLIKTDTIDTIRDLMWARRFCTKPTPHKKNTVYGFFCLGIGTNTTITYTTFGDNLLSTVTVIMYLYSYCKQNWIVYYIYRQKIVNRLLKYNR